MLPTAFTQYWEAETVDRIRLGREKLDHSASNHFRKRGVKPGDSVYVVTIRGGKLFLLGRLVVERMVTREVAAMYLPYEPHEDSDHVLSKPGTEVKLKLREVPSEVAENLIFYDHNEKPAFLSFLKDGNLDPQTLRLVRRLSLQSAKLLDQLL